MNFMILVINFLLLNLTHQRVISSQICSCAQLKSEIDCDLNIGCSWDKGSYCQNKITVDNTNILKITYSQYCDQFAQKDCQKFRSYENSETYAVCAWEQQKCVFFTGCTAYNSTTDADCQQINNSCISDGTHCVEISNCDLYKKQRSCQKNHLGQFCFWDIFHNECTNADTCEKLPTSLNSDQQCRNIINTCTVKNGGGCVESGLNCKDQMLQSQCVWNQNQTISCFWDGVVCKDKICSNAPISMTTDDACKQFRDDGSCTTKENGGCVTRTSCQEAKIKQACIKNDEGLLCFWNGSACLQKTCQNAPKSMITNSECEKFSAGCITTSQGGCVKNISCSSANALAACDKNGNGQPCIWTTLNGQDGCYEKACEIAPKTITTNEECEAYLQGKNCITQNGGGCITQTTCEAIKIQAACIQDIYGMSCFWDKVTLNCRRKSCWNTTVSNLNGQQNRQLYEKLTITKNYCQTFSSTCIPNSTNQQCIMQECENFINQDDCITNVISSKLCIWTQQCYQKQCAFESKATSHQECQNYLSSCTLSNTGLGCMVLPIVCQSVTNENSCVKTANGQLCGWDGNECLDKSCLTASKLIRTTKECQAYLSQCVANNPIKSNGESVIMGCQDLPRSCNQRMSIENCEIIKDGYPLCLWIITQNQCIQKSCKTAIILETTGSIAQGQFTFINCQNYLPNKSCISNNNSDGCQAKSHSCKILVEQNCQLGSKIDGDCYWNNQECVDRICENIKLTTHIDCYAYSQQCTVNNLRSGCQKLLLQCSDYDNPENCKQTSENKYCVWTGLACRNATCLDAPNSLLYISDEECQNYRTNDDCTVQFKVGGQGCVKKSSQCSDYTISAQCHKTITNLTNIDDCKWVVDKCYSISWLFSQSCQILKGSKQMCQGFKEVCTNTDQANSLTPCIIDCQLKTGQKLTFQDCQKLDKSCSVKKDGTGCIQIQATCQAYGSQSNNCFRSSAIGTQGYCIMNDANPSNCQTVNEVSECSLISSQSSLDHNQCQAYSSNCTYLSNGSGCQEFKSNCNLYSGDLQHCTISKQGQCYFDGTDCVRFSTCQSIIGVQITDAQCKSYNQGCTSNANGTACQQKYTTCDQYLTQNSCTQTTINKCIWSGEGCVAIIASIVSTHCSYVNGTQLTNTECGTYHADCTVNSDGTACQRKQATCDLYFTKTSCSFSKATGTAAKCIWSTTACLTITSSNVTTHCAYVTGTNLTDDICASYNPGCTANRQGLQCQYKQATCNKYSIDIACSNSQAEKCVWNPNASPTQCMGVIQASQCNLITGSRLDDIQCSSYNVNCVANSVGTACQEKKSTCSIYTTSESCSKSTAGKCYWNSIAIPQVCILISNTSLCNEVQKPFPLSKEICTTFNIGCTVNTQKSACQEQQNTCDLYVSKATCSFSKAKSPADRCVWNSEVFPAACISVTQTSQCALIQGSELNNTQCQAYFAGCTNLKDGTGCQGKKSYCKNYSTQNTCVIQDDGLLCFWFENACYSLRTLGCDQIVGVDLDHFKCQSYNTSCTSKVDGKSCQEYKSTCEQYLGANACTQTANQKCYYFKYNCISILNVSTDCSKITGTQGTLTYQYCQQYNIGCSVNRLKSGCIQQQQQCQDYSNQMQNCYQSHSGLCVASSINDDSCVAASSAATCEKVYLGDGNYNHINCKEMKNGCTVKGKTQCTNKTCENAIGPFSHESCNKWLNTCTAYVEKTGCLPMKNRCLDQQPASCLYSLEGECTVVESQCVKKTCDTASSDLTHDDDAECSQYSQVCTVARLGGCQLRASCSSYVSQIQCKFNDQNEKCFWNNTIKNCVELKCENIEATSSYDSHAECFTVDQQLACTVKAAEGVAIPGCMSRQPCDSYIIEEQCVINHNGDICVWNTNLISEEHKCQQKSCSTAPSSISTHYDCYLYYNTPTVQCTVALGYDQNGNQRLSGCQIVATCDKYLDIEQCKIDERGQPCEWYLSSCQEKSCDTAPKTDDYDSDIKCKNYFGNTCTVANSGKGCTKIPFFCEQMTEQQCFYDQSGNPCFWTGQSCIKRQCDNAPESMQTPEKCASYLSECTMDSLKCKVRVCEHYELTTDIDCTIAMSTCTTNGKFCVQRGSCLQSQSEAGCVYSSQGEQCQWILQQGNRPAYCTIKSCSTAPNNFTTDEQCKKYFNNCTTKYGGGCITRSTCTDTTIKAACTIDISNKICEWDVKENQCRYQDCIDLTGISHKKCKNLRSDCTIGSNGKCARIQTCQQTNIREACVEGTDGPCLWIENKDSQSKGKCFKYTSCKSLAWNTDEQCKQINEKCTTNGLHCIAITKCSETNTNGGCVTGYDGVCAQSVLQQNNINSKVCSLEKEFQCESSSYTTHSECQGYSNKCTTNGTLCISLMSCQQYTMELGCVINKNGKMVEKGQIISTGICSWDPSSSICRDQNCFDLIGSNHQSCYQQLIDCTSNGSTCIPIQKCINLQTEIACRIAQSSDGPCFWEKAKYLCRPLICQDIKNVTQTSGCKLILSSCVSDGTNCVPKSNCSEYKTKTSCRSYGLDGRPCTFLKNQTCQVMYDCKDAQQQQDCEQEKGKCFWISQKSICSPYTCDSYYDTFSKCNYFYQLDFRAKVICKIEQGKCIDADPSTFTPQDCYVQTGYSFTWNQQIARCQSCYLTNWLQANNSSQTNNSQNTNQAYLFIILFELLQLLLL